MEQKISLTEFLKKYDIAFDTMGADYDQLSKTRTIREMRYFLSTIFKHKDNKEKHLIFNLDSNNKEEKLLLNSAKPLLFNLSQYTLAKIRITEEPKEYEIFSGFKDINTTKKEILEIDDIIVFSEDLSLVYKELEDLRDYSEKDFKAFTLKCLTDKKDHYHDIKISRYEEFEEIMNKQSISCKRCGKEQDFEEISKQFPENMLY